MERKYIGLLRSRQSEAAFVENKFSYSVKRSRSGKCQSYVKKNFKWTLSLDIKTKQIRRESHSMIRLGNCIQYDHSIMKNIIYLDGPVVNKV